MKPRDDENGAVVGALVEVFRRAHSLGLTDEDIAGLVSRPGRHLGVHAVRAWRERHRQNTISLADAVRLASVLDAWVVRPLVDCLMHRAGLEAIDLPERRPGARALEAGALRVGAECGELQAAVAGAAEDGRLSAAELAVIAEQAGDVVREAAHVRESVGGGR